MKRKSSILVPTKLVRGKKMKEEYIKINKLFLYITLNLFNLS